jgi:hypothetical protein
LPPEEALSVRRGLPSDQRTYPRAPIAGTAIVLARRRYVGTYLLENLSASGSLLVGDTRLELGDRVRILIQAGGRLFALSAHVVRHHSRSAQSVFAVQFVAPSPGAQDAIQTLVLHQLFAASREGHLIVAIDRPGGSLGEIVQDLLKLGRRSVRVETALAAIACLQARDAPVDAVIVEDGWADGLHGLELLEFFSVDYPGIRRIVAYRGRSQNLEAALEDGRLDALLEEPWDRASLLRALGDDP